MLMFVPERTIKTYGGE